MCGFAGVLDREGDADRDADAIARRMAGTLEHRGPDDRGAWTDPSAGIALAHRRLAVIDLSPEGRQPMVSGDGGHVIVYNGEVYNHRELRAELEDASGRAFRGTSDTEVVLEACSAWGVEAAVERLVGMFAFAIWDRRERLLHLVRDRLGIKPLHYGWAGGRFVFASESRALRACPGFDAGIDREALALYLRFGSVPGTRSIHDGARKLAPGCLLRVDPGAGPWSPEPVPYWRADEVAARSRARGIDLPRAEVSRELERLLRQAVEMRMIADVPLGVFLSGGTDSSLVTALMQDVAPTPVRSFTIGFREPGYDEAPRAGAVARHLGTDHTEFTVTARDALDVVPLLPEIHDEPFADSSLIPTFLVSRLARGHVTVALTGDGGDEVFGGYTRHVWAERLRRWVAAVPRPARAIAARALAAPPPTWWAGLLRAGGALVPGELRAQDVSRKVARVAAVLAADGEAGLYRDLISHWERPAAILSAGDEPDWEDASAGRWPELGDLTSRIMCLDTLHYLADDILTKVDRASMAVSLEARVPLLDHRVFEYAWRLPVAWKIEGGRGKVLLREILARHVPSDLVEGPKMGFAIPLGAWLRGALRDWAEDLLDPRRMREDGFFHPAAVGAAWSEHVAGRRDRQHELWTVLMFQAWLRHHGG